MQDITKRAPDLGAQAVQEAGVVATARGGRSVPRRLVLYGVLAVLAAVLATVGRRTIAFYAAHVETDDAQIEGHISPVLPRIAGYVAEVAVHDNQQIAAGDVLVRVDPRDFDSRVNMAHAALDSAAAAVTVAEARVAAAKSKSDKAGRDLARAAALSGQKVVSQQDYDTANWAAEAAAAEYTAAVREVSAAQAQVAQRQADLDYATLQLSYTTVTAPGAGVVAKKNVEVGQYVQAGQPLMAIVGEHDVWVVANFKETQLRRMHTGQQVEIHVDAYPQLTFHGRIDSIAAATGAKFSLLPPDNATGNFVKVVQRIPVKVVFTDPPDPAHPLRIGMDVTATVDLD